MKKIILPIVILQLCYISSNAQFVTLLGNQFKLNGNNFYPMVMNYSINAITNNGNYYTSPDHSYNTTNDYECNNLSTCSSQIQSDFNYIAGMGFNSLRITGFGPKYISGQGLIFSFFKQDLSGMVNLSIVPANSSDPGMLAVLLIYDKILELAAATTPHPLKVIFLVSGNSTTLDADEVNAMNDFYSAIALHFNSSLHNDALFAFDLINEPCYSISSKPKVEACSIISTWYDLIKANDTHHLVTIGSCGISDVFSFDPAILKLDFLSLHFYPDYKSYEDRTQSSVQQLGRNRTANDLYWFQQSSILPWIIGETGSTTSTYWGINDGLNGTLTDEGNFSSFSLNATCNCGGSGYSWWSYQDVFYNEPGPYYGGNFYGLLERGSVPTSSAEKQPAVNNFRNYVPGITGSCPVDYSSTFDASKLYYNRYGYPSNTSFEISGTIKDQNGNPVKNAVIGVNVDMGEQPTNVPHYDYFFTHSDENGYFKAIPTQFGFSTPLPTFPGIAMITISAAGAEILKWGWCPGCLNMPNNITLQKMDYDIIVNGETVLNGQTKNYQGRKSLTVSNTTINSGGTATFTSSKEIHLLPGFEAKAGSDVHIFISDIPPDCNDFSNYLMLRQSNPNTSSSSEDIKVKEIELSFKKYLNESSISVFPNPTNSTATVQLNSKNKNASINFVKIYDILGKEILSQKVNETSISLDLSGYQKGVYVIQVNDFEKTFHQKIIIQ
jgi:hypothetical protein